MKKAISFLSLLLMAIIAFAEPHFVSLSNKGGKTTVIFTLTSDDKDSNNGLGIENIMLECDNGKTYKAKHVDAPIWRYNNSYRKIQKAIQVGKFSSEILHQRRR